MLAGGKRNADETKESVIHHAVEEGVGARERKIRTRRMIQRLHVHTGNSDRTEGKKCMKVECRAHANMGVERR